ncbi:hypothetical protein SH449x_000209 [Pirellulaceae bacterium SH449]
MISTIYQIATVNEMRKQQLIVSAYSNDMHLPTIGHKNTVKEGFPTIHASEEGVDVWFEITEKPPTAQYRRVYTICDYDYLQNILAKAELKWPSKRDDHKTCPNCWGTYPAIAIRHCMDGPNTTTGILYRTRGCGSAESVLPELEERLAFLRSHLVDAFIAWLPQ